MNAPLVPRPSQMSRAEFVERYGELYEASPWVAERAYDAGMTEAQDTVAGLAEHFARTMLAAPEDRQLELIRAHPDLADRLAVDQLSSESREEQASAALDRCTPGEFERFQALNAAYRRRFGFPFVIAVRGLDRKRILAAFESRLENEPDTEFQTALREINRIARLRLEARHG